MDNWLERIAIKQRIQTPSIVVRRDVYERLGGFDRRMTCWGEDWEMWVRIAANYPVWYEVEPLALYRISSTSLTGTSTRTGKNIQDFRRAISIVQNYLPKEHAPQLAKTALNNCAFYALFTARQFVKAGDTSAAISQIREALKCRSSIRVLKSSMQLSTELIYQDMLEKFQKRQLNRISS